MLGSDSDSQHKYYKHSREGALAAAAASLRRAAHCCRATISGDAAAGRYASACLCGSFTHDSSSGGGGGGWRSKMSSLSLLLSLIALVLLYTVHVAATKANMQMQEEFLRGLEVVSSSQSSLLDSEALRSGLAAAVSSSQEMASDLQGALDSSLERGLDVRKRLQMLQTNMRSIETATRSLHAQMARVEAQSMLLRRHNVMMLNGIADCHTRLNSTTAHSHALTLELRSLLDNLVPHLSDSALSPARDLLAEAMQKLHAIETLTAPAGLAAAQQKEILEATRQPVLIEQQQSQQQQPANGLNAPAAASPEHPPAVADEQLEGGDTDPNMDAHAAQPPPSAATSQRVRQSAPQRLPRHHSPPKPADPEHPADQVHFVKELPLHKQPQHQRPEQPKDDSPIQPFPEKYTTAFTAAAAAAALQGLNTEERAVLLLNAERAADVRGEFWHAWLGYRQHAWGFDELHPISRTGRNSQYYMSLTMLDALDTLILMGFSHEYTLVRTYIADYLQFQEQEEINLFETTIRVMGGLLAAYGLTNDTLFLHKAQDVADGMIIAFDSPTGLPYGTVSLRSRVASNPDWSSGASTMAEVGSIQLEWSYLSEATGEPLYEEKVDTITARIAGLNKALYPQFINVATGACTSSVITLGARVDSIYEYFLKGFLQSGRRKLVPLALYQNAVAAIEELLVHTASDGEGRPRLTFIAEMHGTSLSGKFDHLVCFVPGMLALGAHTRAVSAEDADRHMKLAIALMHSCNEMYVRQPTGLAPEIVQFHLDGSNARENGETRAFIVDPHATHSMLRPETVESLFIMWRVTKDPIYREWGWNIFQHIKQYARVDGAGYSGLKDVRRNDRPDPREGHGATWDNFNDKMEVIKHDTSNRERAARVRRVPMQPMVSDRVCSCCSCFCVYCFAPSLSSSLRHSSICIFCSCPTAT